MADHSKELANENKTDSLDNKSEKSESSDRTSSDSFSDKATQLYRRTLQATTDMARQTLLYFQSDPKFPSAREQMDAESPKIRLMD